MGCSPRGRRRPIRRRRRRCAGCQIRGPVPVPASCQPRSSPMLQLPLKKPCRDARPAVIHVLRGRFPPEPRAACHTLPAVICQWFTAVELQTTSQLPPPTPHSPVLGSAALDDAPAPLVLSKCCSSEVGPRETDGHVAGRLDHLHLEPDPARRAAQEGRPRRHWPRLAVVRGRWGLGIFKGSLHLQHSL